MIKLSILIPSLNKRMGKLAALLRTLERQTTDEVEILVNLDSGQKPVGQKRNELTEQAQGLYVASIDDDDTISHAYISLLLRGISTNPDCCSLVGRMTVNGRNGKLFKHSIEYNGWYERGNVLYRFPNHLNCIRASIAKQMKYPSVSHGEDKAYSEQLQASGLLKIEHKIEPIIYHYDYRTRK